MRDFLMLFGLSKFRYAKYIAVAVGITVAFFTQSYFPNQTLLLFGILLYVIIGKNVKSEDLDSLQLDKVAGIFVAFSLSMYGLISYFLSAIFFIFFDEKKPSIIKKLYDSKRSWGIVMSSLLSGAFAGILSSAITKAIS